MDIKLIVAAHKPYRMPDDKMYIPLHVGAEGKDSFGFVGDNTGENISLKNPGFCEVTGLYWAWKNLDADYIGLAHYRRHFSLKKHKDVFESILTFEQAKEILTHYPCILPKKQNYFIESIFSHYTHTHSIEHLLALESVISRNCPEYLDEFQNTKKRTSAHMFNMLILRKDLFCNYCEWLFDILFELEKEIDTSDYNSFDARVFGRMSELLLDIWVYKNKIEFKEIPYIYTEKIDWFRKIRCFIGAKFFGKKYGKSF